MRTTSTAQTQSGLAVTANCCTTYSIKASTTTTPQRSPEGPGCLALSPAFALGVHTHLVSTSRRCPHEPCVQVHRQSRPTNDSDFGGLQGWKLAPLVNEKAPPWGLGCLRLPLALQWRAAAGRRPGQVVAAPPRPTATTRHHPHQPRQPRHLH